MSLSNPMMAQDHSGHNHDGHDHSSHQHDGHDHSGHSHDDGHGHGHGKAAPAGCHFHDDNKPFNAGDKALHHIADANSFHIVGDLYVPLPCMLYAADNGKWSVFLSSKFHAHHHGNGELAIDRFVMEHGIVKRVIDTNFPLDQVQIDGFCFGKKTNAKGKEIDITYAIYQGQKYELENKSTLDGGLVGGGITSYYDFSITKNVFTMILVFFLMFFLFRKIARDYRNRDMQAPKGVQSFMEPLFTFIQDEAIKPVIGPKYKKFLPFIMSLFFFILGLNLIGQIPFFPGSANVTGNIAVTIVLAVFTFIITTINGNAHYWQHIFNMPGIPWAVKLILTPIEILGLFLKPFTLLVRLFANITAGHIVILSFVGLIFILGESGRNMGGTIGGIVVSTFLTLFMMVIELLVAFIQAFIFTIFTASYIGAAVEEPAHH